MVANDRQAAQIASTLAWLEDNVRETKAQIVRLGQQLEQAQTQVWELAHRVQRAEEAASAVSDELGAVPRLESLVGSASDRAIRLEERQTATDARLTDAVRLHQLEVEHVRLGLNELVKRVDGWERVLQHWAPRFDVLEEIGRRSQESTSVVRQRVEELERFVEHVDQRAGRTADGMKRYEQDLARLNGELEALHKQDSAAADRLQVYAELFKRLEEEISVVAQQADVRREFDEKLDLQRSNIRRGEERLNALEAGQQETHARLEDHERVLSSLDSRERLFRERLSGLQEEIARYRTHVADQFQKAQAAVERQKRRRIEEIEREIRELKVNGYRPAED